MGPGFSARTLRTPGAGDPISVTVGSRPARPVRLVVSLVAGPAAGAAEGGLLVGDAALPRVAGRDGQAAVEAACDGESGKMITVIRGDTDHYTCETGLAPLEEVANGVKTLPKNWINDDGCSLAFQYYKYCLPLIQGEASPVFENGLPVFCELNRSRVQRQTETYEPS